MNKKEQLSKDIQELKAKLADMEEQLNKPEQFELKYPKWNTLLVEIDRVSSNNAGEDSDYLEHGRYRATEEYANKSLERNKRANRLEALVEQVSIELGMINWEVDWHNKHQQKYYIYCMADNDRWGSGVVAIMNYPETVYMPKEVATRVCEILNNKEYKL